MDIKISGRKISVVLKKDCYELQALHKCFYWYGAAYSISFGSNDENYVVELVPKGETENTDSFVEKIRQDIIDFQVRHVVSKETENVRSLLVAKAFANGELDDQPYGDVSDPVGYNPEVE